MKWIDAHSHLNEEQLKQAQGGEVSGWVMGGIEPDEWKRQLEVGGRWPGQIYPAFGLHPWWVHAATWEMVWDGIRLLEQELPKAVALGEIGLDFFKERKASEPQQKEAFQRQLELAKKYDKPLVLHIVQAHAEAKKMLEGFRRGIIHAFSGSLEEAKDYRQMGFLISVSGNILKEGYKGLKAAVKELPLESLSIETDSAAPMELFAVADAVAKIRGLKREEVLDQSTLNVKRTFGI